MVLGIRGIFLVLFVALVSTILSGFSLPFIALVFLFNKKAAFFLGDFVSKIWALLIAKFLKIILKVDYQVTGLKNLPNQACIVACKHQSMFETIIMHLIFNRPSYIYKKELLKMPFYGWFLRFTSSITVDRKGAARAIKKLNNDAKNALNNGHNVIIFPQGTRTTINQSTQEVPYKPGIYLMYKSCKTPVIPCVLNSIFSSLMNSLHHSNFMNTKLKVLRSNAFLKL